MVDNRIADLAQWDLGGGWRARVDTDLSGRNQGKHVRVYDRKGNEWTQNEDGSRKDKGRTVDGAPPAKVRKKLKERGWDWDNNAEKQLHSEGDQMVTDNGEMYEFKNGQWEYIGRKSPIPGIPIIVTPNVPTNIPPISLPSDMVPMPVPGV